MVELVEQMMEFWNWFVKNEGRFRETAPLNTQDLYDESQEYLVGIGENLSLEWHEIEGQPGQCEVVITANAHEPDIEIIEDMCKRAPKIEGWKITALRQADHFEYMTVSGDVEINPDDCTWRALQSKIDPDKWALMITAPGYEIGAQEAYGPAAHSMLVSGLGERVVARQIQFSYVLMEMKLPPGVDIDWTFRPMSELAQFLEDHWVQRSAKSAFPN
jgi:hypothetical protein